MPDAFQPAPFRFPLRAAALARSLVAGAVLVALWEAAVRVGGVRPYLLPPPSRVFATLVRERTIFLEQALVTLGEIVAGLAAATLVAVVLALLLSLSAAATRLLSPLLSVSQALPVFAIAPLLVVWLGFGLGSKVAMAGLIIFFPILSAFLDGLKRTDPIFLDLARTAGATPIQTLRLIRVPAALPSLATGLRVGATVAPIGAVVGEWVGSSAGLGFLMIQANARMQTDRVFAALVLLALAVVVVRGAVDLLIRLVLGPWVPGEGLSRKDGR